MTAKQKALYWRTWGRVRRVFIDYGGFSPADADAERKTIHADALGTPKSSADFSNRDLDAVLDHFRVILTLPDGPPTGPSRAEEMPRRRLIFAIEKTGLGDPYLAAIAQDQFRTADWRSLPEADLVRLRSTATSRSRAKARRAVSA